VFAALFSGQIGDIIGRKYTFAIAFGISIVSTTIQTLSTNNPMFFAGKFLNGFAIGTLKAISTTYIGEVSASL
jgi:MFS transporter, SP family, general alpha glucoside:H+ symporter